MTEPNELNELDNTSALSEPLRIERLSDSGAAVSHTKDGLVVFVHGGVPGDLARVSLNKQHNNYCEASILELIEPSSLRVKPLCPLTRECGGCAWQHVAYSLQLEAKRQIVVDALSRIAHFSTQRANSVTSPTLSSPQEYYYRNKIVLGAQTDAQGNFSLGFRRQASHNITKPGHCVVAQKAIAKTPKALRGALSYAQGSSDLGIYSVSVRHSHRSKQTEVALWTEPGSFNRAGVAAIVGTAVKATSIVRVIAKRKEMHNVKSVEVLAGTGSWKEKLVGLEYLTSAPAFFQINSGTAELLITEVLGALKNFPLHIADLYAGGGTFSLPLAQAGHQVVAVESVGHSVRDLRRNAQINGLDLAIEGGDVARILPALGRLDALVVDPPRAGLAEPVIGLIASASPKRIIYVSCNPATWARDIMRLEQQGYLLQSVQPVDQFPQTPHVELVSVLDL